MKKSITPISIILWIFAGILAVYTVWALSQAVVYVQALFTGGAAIGTDFTVFDIVQFYYNQMGAPLIFTLLLAAAGVLTMAPAAPKAECKPSDFGDFDLDEVKEEVAEDLEEIEVAKTEKPEE